MTGEVECRYCGRDFTTEEMALRRALIAAFPPPNRFIGWTPQLCEKNLPLYPTRVRRCAGARAARGGPWGQGLAARASRRRIHQGCSQMWPRNSTTTWVPR